MKLVEMINYEKSPLREKQPFIADGDRANGSPVVGGSGRKVLVVDDNPVVLKACELKLKANGFEVVTASDPSTCLGLARQEAPDAIVLDLNFPVGKVFTSFNWDGVQILRWLKHCEKAAGIPVIILTGDESENTKSSRWPKAPRPIFKSRWIGKCSPARWPASSAKSVVADGGAVDSLGRLRFISSIVPGVSGAKLPVRPRHTAAKPTFPVRGCPLQKTGCHQCSMHYLRLPTLKTSVVHFGRHRLEY